MTLLMENIYEEIISHESLKKKLQTKHNFMGISEKNLCKKCWKNVIYCYKITKYNLIIFFNTNLLDFLCFVNPNFSHPNKIPTSSPSKNNLQPLKNKEIMSEKLEIDFDEEERNPADFREIALYMKKEPRIVLKEGINVQSI